MRIDLVTPLPASWYSRLWTWLTEDAFWNFDDYGPKSCDAFFAEMQRRDRANERSWGVLVDGRPSGAIGYQPITPRLGTFHGIAFASRVHGTGAPREAVGQVIAALFAGGVEKICASYFADNARVDRFLAGLGATCEGLLVAHTLRDRTPTDMKLVAIFNPAIALRKAG